MSRLLRASLALCLLTVCSFAAVAAEAPYWPQWRGPVRDGLSPDTGLLDEWPRGGPKLLWTAHGMGIGFSGVSIADGRLYTMGDVAEQQCVICLDAASGNELWKTVIGQPFTSTGYLGPRCTPTIDADRVYAVGTSGDLVCLSVEDGQVLWKKNFKTDFAGKMMSGWGYSESPLVDGDKLVCTPGGANAMIVALNKHTGDLIWRSVVPPLGEAGKDGAAYSSIVISEACGVRQYVQLIGRGTIGVSADDGTFLWGYNRIANKTASIPTPIVRDDYVFTSTGYNTGAALLKLNRTSSGIEAEEVYFLDGRTFQNHHGGMVLVGDYIYAGHAHNNGFPVCIEMLTGKIVWNGGRGAGTGSAAVGYADGDLYFRYQNGVMALIEATPKGYNLKSTFDIPESDRPSWPHPVITGGRLFLREQDALFCYDVTE